MPVRLNWSKGRNLGLAFIYLGIMGLVQVIFIIIAQYAMEVGQIYVVSIIPAGVILATFYSVIVIFEASTTMNKFREARPFIQRKNLSDKEKKGKIQLDWTYLRPLLTVILVYAALFGAMVGILYAIKKKEDIEVSTIFIISSNVGAIGSLIFAAYMDTAMKRRSR